MDEIEFRNWLSKSSKKKKVQGDCVSRLKRIERELGIDLEKKYKETKLQDILDAFSGMGENDEMAEFGKVNLPIGKKYMGTYSHSLKEYIKFKRDTAKKQD